MPATAQPKDNAMGHEPIELSAYLDGELAPDVRRRVEQRLAADAAYAEALGELERTRTMIAMCVDQPRFHGRLLETVRDEAAAHTRRRRMTLSTLTIAALLAVVAALWLLQPRTPAPQEPGGAPPAVAIQSPEKAQEPFTVAQTPAPETTVESAEPSAALGSLPLEIVGTVTGENPSAIIATLENGQRVTHTHTLGAEVLPGVVMTEVGARSVTFDNQGTAVTIPIGRRLDVDEPDRLAGLWRLSEDRQGDLHEEQLVLIERTAPQIVTITSDNGGDLGMLEYTLAGRRLQGTLAMKNQGGPIRLTGQFDREWERLVIDVFEENASAPEARFVLARVEAEDDVLAAMAARDLRERIERMYNQLVQYARANEDRFPDSPEEMSSYESQAELWAIKDNEEFTYHPGMSLSQPQLGGISVPPMPPYEPAATYPDRLMDHERQLASVDIDVLTSARELIRIENTALDVVGTLTTSGKIEVTVGTDRNPSSTELANMRASCQNNLKQLGLIIKMFENEQHGYSPPGWRTVYPEYLTDTSILTCPKDPPGTDSYIYLLPATHMADYARQFVDDPSNPAANAMSYSEIPMVMNRTEWPQPTPGRNVLFMDGHVEFVSTVTQEGRDRIQSYLRQN